MHAVISDRGRQATVRVGDVVNCDLNESWKVGEDVTFDEVLLVSNEGNVQIGAPHITGASVTGKILGQTKGEKLVIFRFKRRKNVRVKNGHRQSYTKVQITGING
ncbi:MAG: large subunit ribosomal protein L21 [Planctomycetota bacterium]|jgi:large subunit ribosomal protein L21